ncbi:MAG: hypothetical protein V3S89_12060 [Desulfobacterales bacterium]
MADCAGRVGSRNSPFFTEHHPVTEARHPALAGFQPRRRPLGLDNAIRKR